MGLTEQEALINHIYHYQLEYIWATYAVFCYFVHWTGKVRIVHYCKPMTVKMRCKIVSALLEIQI